MAPISREYMRIEQINDDYCHELRSRRLAEDKVAHETEDVVLFNGT